VIIGAGPAGLATAHEITENRRDMRILIADKGLPVEKRVCPAKQGSKCANCKPCRVVCGPGGAGAYSDGKIFFDNVGGYLEKEGDRFTTDTIIRLVRAHFTSLFPEGLPGKDLRPNLSAELRQKIMDSGLRFKLSSPHHLGTENCEEFVKRIISDLQEREVEFWLETDVLDFAVNRGYISLNVLKESSNLSLNASKLVIATGKGGSEWLSSQMKNLGVQPVVQPTPYVGVRIEAPRKSLEPLKQLGGDPKLYYDRGEGTVDQAKTHCFADGGYAVQLNYENGITLIDGYSYVSPERASLCSSFNILVKTAEQTSYEAWHDLLKAFKLLTKEGLPILQRLGDFYDFKASSEQKISTNKVHPTLNSYNLGDISDIFSAREVHNIVSFLEKLSHVIPDIVDKDNLLYAPAAEWYVPRYIPVPAVESRMRPKGLNNIYIVGDGAGLSQGIVMAATTGIVAGWSIANEG
jgi:uncharacterized FAD-dependent dehydrogenase